VRCLVVVVLLSVVVVLVESDEFDHIRMIGSRSWATVRRAHPIEQPAGTYKTCSTMCVPSVVGRPDCFHDVCVLCIPSWGVNNLGCGAACGVLATQLWHKVQHYQGFYHRGPTRTVARDNRIAPTWP
jgi:hypothetical protein